MPTSSIERGGSRKRDSQQLDEEGEDEKRVLQHPHAVKIKNSGNSFYSGHGLFALPGAGNL